MSDTKKPQSSPIPQPIRESVDFGEAPCTDQSWRNQEVSNTLPAPPNPHRDEQGSNKKG